MRRRTPIFVAGLLAAACTSVERNLVSVPQFAHVADLDGTPDLIVDSKDLATSWVVYDQELKESFCTLQEGGVPPGTHRVLRFTVTTPNIGDADIAIGDPNKHWDPNGDGNGSDSDGLYENDACHRHFHFRNYATYSILSADGSKRRTTMPPPPSPGCTARAVGPRGAIPPRFPGTRESASVMRISTTSGSAASTSCWTAPMGKPLFRRAITSSASR